MASLLPSEVARLVLGYLEDNGCQKSSEKLLQELAELSEFVKLRRKGRKVATRIGNQCLEDMLMDYSAAKDFVMESVRNNSSTLSSVPSTDSLLNQVKALMSIILSNKSVIKKQKPSIGTVKRVKQHKRTIMLQRDLQKKNSQQQANALNGTAHESLPDPHHRDSAHVECLCHQHPDKGQCSSCGHSSSHIHSSPNAGHITQDVEDTRQDSLCGDSTSTSIAHDLDSSHQRRKGTVKRRSHGCEQSPTKMSPVLDTEANFEKFLKNLYENTALHEKIAESINRGLSIQCKAGPSHSEGEGATNISPCSKKSKESGSSPSTAEGRERNCGSAEEAAWSRDGDATLLKEFDHIVNGIVSETTSDPVFENFMDEVFGCTTPPQCASKGEGPATSSQGSSHDHPSGPPRLLSTPVPPPPSITPSHSLLHTSIHSSSIPPSVCQEPPPHSLSTPPNHMPPVSDTSHHLPSHVTPHIPPFTSTPHSDSTAYKPFQELSPKRLADVWTDKNLPNESNNQGAKDVQSQSSEAPRDATQSTSLSSPKDPTANSWSPSTRVEVEDSSTTKQAVTAPSESTGTESPSSKEGSEGTRASPPSPTTENRLTKKRKHKQSNKAKRKKEDDKNFGEQLLKEFADFQSSRPDKIHVQEKSDSCKSPDRCEVSDETDAQPHDSPVEEGRTKERENACDVTKKLGDECTQKTPSPVPQSTCTNEIAVLGADAGKSIAVKKEHIEGSVHLEESRFQSLAEPDSTPLCSGALSVPPYGTDGSMEETEKGAEYENASGEVVVSEAVMPVHSSAIPEPGTSTATLEENMYTITELTPMNPVDLTTLVSSLCETETPDIAYPNHMQVDALPNAPEAASMPTCPSSEVHSSSVWNPTSGAAPQGHLEGTMGKEEGFTIILPPVSSKEEANEQFIALFGGDQIPSSELVTAPVLPDTPSMSCMKGRRRPFSASFYNSELVTIAPKRTSRVPLPHGFIDAQEDSGKQVTTYTLPNKVTISIPGMSGIQATDIRVPKKRRKNASSKPKSEPRKSEPKKAKETKEATATKKRQPGRVVNVSQAKRKLLRRSKRLSNQKQEEAEEAEEDVSNNIIATALSFALNSVTPEKSGSPSAEVSVKEPTVIAEMALGVEAANAEVGADAEVGDAVDMLGTVITNNGCSFGVGNPINESCDAKVQEQMTESVVSNTAAQSPTKQTSTKCSPGRSPQLKALLHLSKSISPAKRASVWNSVSQSEESPRIRVLRMRGSQSTPSHKNSHIRVLDFSTPQKGKVSGGSPQKAVASLKFSPPSAGKKPPLKSKKASHLSSRNLKKDSSAASKTLTNIMKENKTAPKMTKTQLSLRKQEKVKSRKPLSNSWRSLKNKHERSNHSSNADQGSSRQNCTSETDFPQVTTPVSLLMTEDEDSIVLHLDGEDSSSSGGRTPPTDRGSVELFELPREDGYQDFNSNIDIRDLKSDFVDEEDLPDISRPLPSSRLTEHSGAKIKQMTPCKATHTTSSSTSVTPLCFEPPTPLLPSEQKSSSLPCNDLNTPVPQLLPNVNKTPLIKDYPQGPYSNSSVGTSYYMPSERSLTESEGYSPDKLDTLWEKTLTEELQSPPASNQSEVDLFSHENANRKNNTANVAKDDKVKHSPRKSPNKLSGKAMGEMIEQEMSRLFSGHDSSSSIKDTSQASQDCTTDSPSNDSSKGKQARKRRVPSKKYQNIAESPDSEDEVDRRNESIKFSSINSNKRSDEASASRPRLHKRKRRSGGSDRSGTGDELDEINKVMTDRRRKRRIISSSPDISEDSDAVKPKRTSRNGSLLSEEELHLEDASKKRSENQTSDSQESSSHLPQVSQQKEMEEGVSDVHQKVHSNFLESDTSSDSTSVSSDRSNRGRSLVEQSPRQAAADGRKVKLKSVFGSISSFSDDSDFESPTKKKKISESRESFSSNQCTPVKDKEEEEGENTGGLRRSRRVTKGRGVEKYQAAPIVAVRGKRGRGNKHQRAGRGRGKKAGNVHVEEVVIEAVFKSNASCPSENTFDDPVASRKNATKRGVGKRRFSVMYARGRSYTPADRSQQPGQGMDSDETLDAPPEALDEPGETEEGQTTIQKETNNEVQEVQEQQSSKGPFTCWGSSMKTHERMQVRNTDPATSAHSLGMCWSSKLEHLYVNTAPSEDKGAKEQPCVPPSGTDPLQENDSSTTKNDEEEQPCNPDARHLQKGINSALAGCEGKAEQPCASTAEAHDPHKKVNGSIKQPCVSTPEAQDTTHAEAEGVREQPCASTRQPKQPQEKDGACRSSQPEGCARTSVYQWSVSKVYIQQLQEMGDMGQILNITGRSAKRKGIRKNQTVTSEPSPNDKAASTSMTGAPEGAVKQTSTSAPSGQEESTSSTNADLAVRERSTTSNNASKPLMEQQTSASQSASEPSVEHKSDVSNSIPKLSLQQKNSVPKSDPKHCIADKVSSQSASEPSDSRNHFVKRTPQPPVGLKGSTSEGSAGAGNTPSPLPSARDSLSAKRKVDKVPGGSKKPPPSSSQLSTPETPKEHHVSHSVQESSNSVDTVTLPPHRTEASKRPSPLPTLSSPREHQVEGLISVFLRENDNAEVSPKLPDDQDFRKNASSSRSSVTETKYGSFSRGFLESYGDLGEASEEGSRKSHAVLPLTPEEKVERICHAIVKEGKAMVALPSSSKPHLLPEPRVPQSAKGKPKLSNQADSSSCVVVRQLDLSSARQGSGSVENAAKQSLKGRSKAENSQKCSSKAEIPEENSEDLFRDKTVTSEDLYRDKTVTSDHDQLEIREKGSLGKNKTVAQGNIQRESRSQSSNTPQNTGKDESECQTKPSSEKPSTSCDITTETSKSSGKQISADFKQCPAGDKNQISEHLRKDDSEKMEEEEDSDVLRIQESSENENEEEVICTLNLTLTGLIDIFSLNIEPEKEKKKAVKKPTVLATRQKKQVRKRSSQGMKAKNLTQKIHPAAPVTPKKDQFKERKRSSGSTSGPPAPVEEQHPMKAPRGVSSVVGKGSSLTNMQSPSTSSTRPPKEGNTPSRMQKRTKEDGHYAGRSTPAERTDKTLDSTKKRRRITPTRIGDVEWHVKASKGSWGQLETPKGSHKGQNKANTGVHLDMMEGRGHNLTQTERPARGQGGLSERSASSLSSLSPGCLLISESPRGADSSPSHPMDMTAPVSHGTLGSPCTTAPIVATPTKRDALGASSFSSASVYSLSDARARKQQGGADMYYIDSETSRELEEKHGLGKQRRARHMAQELHRGGNLEIARSPDKQLAVMMSHPHEGSSVYMNEESFPSLSRTPPTPGKHLFIPPSPALTSCFSSTSNSSSSFSQVRQDHGNLPLKKRKDVVSISDQFTIHKANNSLHASE